MHDRKRCYRKHLLSTQGVETIAKLRRDSTWKWRTFSWFRF